MNYITLIFDLKNSKNIKNRNEIQHILINCIKNCNQQYAKLIASPFLITLGDEWQGLLYPNTDYQEIISFFKLSLPPKLSFYVGVGIGAITVYDFELTVNQLDGPSFHSARRAIEIAKSNQCFLVVC